MNNDLISREALKNNERHYDEEGCRIFYESEIDKAPAVTPTFGMFRAMLCETCQAYATNRAIAKLADEYTRPRGKWILCHDTYFSKCSICGDIWLNEECKNYCPNCGADMREEGGK